MLRFTFVPLVLHSSLSQMDTSSDASQSPTFVTLLLSLSTQFWPLKGRPHFSTRVFQFWRVHIPLSLLIPSYPLLDASSSASSCTILFYVLLTCSVVARIRVRHLTHWKGGKEKSGRHVSFAFISFSLSGAKKSCVWSALTRSLETLSASFDRFFVIGSPAGDSVLLANLTRITRGDVFNLGALPCFRYCNWPALQSPPRE